MYRLYYHIPNNKNSIKCVGAFDSIGWLNTVKKKMEKGSIYTYFVVDTRKIQWKGWWKI